MATLNFIKDVVLDCTTNISITVTYLMSEYGSNLIQLPVENYWTELDFYNDDLPIETLYRLNEILHTQTFSPKDSYDIPELKPRMTADELNSFEKSFGSFSPYPRTLVNWYRSSTNSGAVDPANLPVKLKLEPEDISLSYEIDENVKLSILSSNISLKDLHDQI